MAGIFKAIIFDLDGTLLNTLDDITNCANEALQKYGFAGADTSAFRNYIGHGIVQLFQDVLGQDLPDEVTLQNIIKDYRVLYSEKCAECTKPYDGVVELLSRLSQQNIALACLSNKTDEFTKRLVNFFFSDFSFTAVAGVSDTVRPKPDPSGALNIASDLKLDPSEIIFVGDSEPDMQTAVNAGMFPLGVTWGFRSAEQVKAAGAKLIVNKPLQILDFLQENCQDSARL